MDGVGARTLVKGMSHSYLFVTPGTPDMTKTVWGHAGRVVVGVSNGAPAAASVGGPVYASRLNPSESGTYCLAVYDASDTLLHQAEFRVVDALPEQHALGLQPPFRGLVPIYPTATMVNGATIGTPVTLGAVAPNRAIVSYGGNVIAYDGYVYGMDIATGTSFGLASLSSLRFVTVDPASTLVRGVSNELVGASFYHPDTGASVSPTAASPLFKRVFFDRPVPCRAGDWWGLSIDDTSNSGASPAFWQVASQTNKATVQQLRASVGPLSLTSVNSFAQFGSITGQIQIKPLMNPPSIALCGHSFYASSPNSSPVFANTGYAYSRSQDLAAMLSELLGVPVVNCAVGGSNIDQWIGNAGHFATNVAPLRPSLVLFDTTRNDAGGIVPNLSESEYCLRLDEVKRRCDQIGAELMLIEPCVDHYAATTAGTASAIEAYAALERRWALQNGVCVVPTYYSLSQALQGGTNFQTGDPSRRRQLSRIGNGVPDYDNPDGSGDLRVHPSQAGRRGLAIQIAATIRRRALDPATTRDAPSAPTITPPSSDVRATQLAFRVAGSRR